MRSSRTNDKEICSQSSSVVIGGIGGAPPQKLPTPQSNTSCWYRDVPMRSDTIGGGRPQRRKATWTFLALGGLGLFQGGGKACLSQSE